MKNKKLVLSVLSTALVSSMAASAFAMPSAGIYIGGNVNEMYSLDYFTNEAYLDQAVRQVLKITDFSQVLYVDGKGKVANFNEIAKKDLGSALHDEKKADFSTKAYTKIGSDLKPNGTYDVQTDKDVPGDVVTPPTGDLKVDSVSANNLRTVTVNFSKAVDSTTVNAATVVVAGYTGENLALPSGAGKYTVALADDNKSATITLGGVVQNSALTIGVNGVKTDAGQEIKNFSQTVTAIDVTTPTVTELKTSAPNQFVIKFSEPLKTAPTVKVNDGAVSNVTLLSQDGTYATVNAAALNVGDNKVTIEGGADYADLPVLKQDKVLKYEVTANAPVVSVKEATGNSVTLKFDRNVVNLQSGTTLFSHTYPGLNQVAGSSASVTKVSDSEYKVDFGANPFPPGTTKLYISYTANTADTAKIKDAFGNVLQSATLDITTTVDLVKPEVSTINFDSTTGKVVVNFSEKVDTVTGGTVTNYVLRNSLNQVVTIGVPVVNGSKVELPVGSLKAGNYSLEVKNVKDQAVVKNTMDPVTKQFVVADTEAPKLASAYVTTGTTVHVTFTKDMNSSDLVNKAYYLFDDKALPAGTVVAASGSKAVDITFPIGTVLVSKKIVVNGEMHDAIGNKVGGFASAPVVIGASTDSSITDNDISDVTFVANNKFQITLKQQVKAVDATQFKINAGGLSAAATAQDVTYVNNPNGTATVTVVTKNGLGTGINTNVASDLTGFTSVNFGAGAFTNMFGVASTPIVVSSGDVNDGISASLKSVVAADSNLNGQLDTLTVTFDESVKADSIQATDFAVDGYVVKGVKSVSGDKVTLTIQENGVSDTDAKPVVTLIGNVDDLNGNSGIGAVKQVTAADTASPVIVSAVAANKTGGVVGTVEAGDFVTLTFSEATNKPDIDATNIDSVLSLGAHSWKDGAGAIGSATWSADGKQLVITLSAGTSAPTVVLTDVITPSNTIKDTAAAPNDVDGTKAISGSF
ncbi:hypothetical protein ACQCN2_10045 [Brevibacillus ginsengisoli]|uniref:hypothetical protein n=1 Tax=Brevibacillus ginsengisoli TaxID=363854 RepID=UPI003CF4E373